ncbi:hypothetical protein SPBR_05965 [Sporothrix brasiliensis 5110]|uniref:PLC-like phosphodiesterase n=1 Tax=Sporothrix brasiliensis 5110 TaxID=1398154 RepID=A0A0C2JBB9_9PEZI|nr:uncharacterized protein SPBR_05965 [Sporothrix brasiliensis 5110]KIH94147.1 hypothetical protein SPBR_05965 [Sporothrix brasiliensis 5110]
MPARSTIRGSLPNLQQALGQLVKDSNSSNAPPNVTTTIPLTNITVCNGYAELCSRKYSNVTMVGAHNSPFVQRNNLAANQNLKVTQQLDDGIRFVQAQMQFPVQDNGTGPHFCHTSCELLDAGPIAGWLTEVRTWVDAHPQDFVTILLGNGNYSAASTYAPHIEASGLVPYAFVPPPTTTTAAGLALDAWPTLGEMLADGKRVLMMLDYKANQTAYPWLLDEFAYLWETPFDPVVTSVPVTETLPCPVQRPPDLPPGVANSTLYLMNHNVNLAVSLLGQNFTVPALALLNQSNAATGINSLGAAAEVCVDTWGRPPLILNVDYYDQGAPPGSVFEVAAKLNGVSYENTCCGKTALEVVSGAVHRSIPLLLLVTITVAAVMGLWLW